MSLNIVEPSYTSTNHHNSSKDGFDKYMKRCINTKLRTVKPKLMLIIFVIRNTMVRKIKK